MVEALCEWDIAFGATGGVQKRDYLLEDFFGIFFPESKLGFSHSEYSICHGSGSSFVKGKEINSHMKKVRAHEVAIPPYVAGVG